MENKKKSEYRTALESYKTVIPKVNERILRLGEYSSEFCMTLNTIREAINRIRNVPEDEKITFERVETLQFDLENKASGIMEKLFGYRKKEAGATVAATGAGVAAATAGPTMAMGIASVFGTASTGAAISSLSGVAATNAALAWLGGGTIAAGGGGVAAGSALLALLGPIGWTVAGVAVIGSGALFLSSGKNRAVVEKIYTRILKRDRNNLKLALLEINERIEHIVKENDILRYAVRDIDTFGTDYNEMSESQQYALGAYVNQMNASIQLLTTQIAGLKPKYSDDDYEEYLTCNRNDLSEGNAVLEEKRKQIINLANFLYMIELDEKEEKILWRELKNNKSFISAMEIRKSDFSFDLFLLSLNALDYKRNNTRQREQK